MIVTKNHDRGISGSIIEAYIKGIVRGVFRGKDFSFRKEQRKIKDHWHWHIIFILE